MKPPPSTKTATGGLPWWVQFDEAGLKNKDHRQYLPWLNTWYHSVYTIWRQAASGGQHRSQA